MGVELSAVPSIHSDICAALNSQGHYAKSADETTFSNSPSLSFFALSPSPKTVFGYLPIAIFCLELRIPHPLFISAPKGLFRPFQSLLSLPRLRSSDTEINGDTFMAYLNVTSHSLLVS